MLNHKTFGGFLIAVGIGIFVSYFVVLLINHIWALIIAVTIFTCIVGIMFFWLGFKVITTGQIPKEGVESEKVHRGSAE